MPWRSDLVRRLSLHLLRNLVLFFLLINSFLQLRDQLDLLFLSVALILGACAGLLMERGRLRFLPSLALAAVIPIALRLVFFAVFRLQRAIASAPATDFLFFYFDKDFFPALVGYAVAWLFNFLALRHPRFPIIEAVLNSGLLVVVFWSQAGYRLSLYSHPLVYALVLSLFVIAEFFALLLSGNTPWARRLTATKSQQPTGPGAGPVSSTDFDLRTVASFAWIVVPLLLIFLFFLLGRYSEAAVKAGGGLMRPTLFRFDFAPYVRLESEIRTSNDTVMLFRTEGKADRFLLRRFVLGSYDPQRGFFMEPGHDSDESSTVVPDAPETYPDPGFRDREKLAQEYYFLTLDPSSLIAVNYPVRVAPLSNWKSSSFLRVYRVESKMMRSSAFPQSVTVRPPLPAGELAYYTRWGDDPLIKGLAEQITSDSKGYYAKVASIEEYLRSNYLYSLKPGIAADGNQLNHFLFESKKGYCSYFAFAMALMCRSLGFPARVSVGFYVDPRSEILNFYEVKAFQAHAWVEVWFGDLGWVEFDPTSDQLAPGEDFTPYAGPDKDRMAKLIAEILKNQSGMTEERTPQQTLTSSVRHLGAAFARIALFVARLWYLTLPTLYALFLLVVKLLPSLPELLSRSRRRRVKGSYRLTLVRLAGVGLSRRPGESLLEHARRVEQDRGVPLPRAADQLLKAAFARAFEETDEKRARAASRELRVAFRARLSLATRLLGLINPMGSLTRMM
ncbi:MAG TPA: transglutaminase domain-containing protein [Spirochaetia bacterium]|nr:transglutaminase domain-containing protein [Spirochaetia bacterium]